MSDFSFVTLDRELCDSHLESAVHAADPRDREHAIRAFALLASQVRASSQLSAVLQTLELALRTDESPSVRIASTWALAEVGEHSSAEALFVACDTDADATVRHHASEHLKRFPVRVQRGAALVVAGKRLVEARLDEPLHDHAHHPYRFLVEDLCVRCDAVAPIVPQGEEPWCFSCHGYVVLDCGAHVLSVFAASCSGAHEPVTRCAMCEDGSGPTDPNHSHIQGDAQ